MGFGSHCCLNFSLTGVGHSLPRISFFEATAERALWGADALNVLNISADVAREWAQSKIINQLAGERQIDILRHINTDQTAHDMLRITEAHGKGKLQYWGFSYVPLAHVHSSHHIILSGIKVSWVLRLPQCLSCVLATC